MMVEPQKPRAKRFFQRPRLVTAATPSGHPGRLLLIPSFITLIGIFCGFVAIVSAFKGNFDYATKCIAVAFLLDGLDGRVARRLNATSAFGREFDSLSDCVSFGVAPAILAYTWGFSANADEFGLLVAFLFVACGAARLARFNISTSSEVKKHFVGLPIPGAAAALVSVVYAHPAPLTSMTLTGVVLAYTLLLAFFMVSTIPFLSVKHFKLDRTNARLHFLLLALAVALVWYNSRTMLLLGCTAYALSGPIVWFKNRGTGKNEEARPTNE